MNNWISYTSPYKGHRYFKTQEALDEFKEKELVWMAGFKKKAESIDHNLEDTTFWDEMSVEELESSLASQRHYDSDETHLARLERTQADLIKAQKNLESAKFNVVFRQFMIDLIEKKKAEVES